MSNCNVEGSWPLAKANTRVPNFGHVLIFGRVFFAVTLVVFLFQYFDFSKIINRLFSVDILFVSLACGILVGQHVLSSLRWHHILRWHSVLLRFRISFLIYSLGAVANLVMVNAIAGFSVRGLLLVRAGAGASRSLGALLIERLSALAGLVLCLLVGTAASCKLLIDYLEQAGWQSTAELWLSAIAGIIMTGAVAVFLWQFKAVRTFAAQIKESFLSTRVLALLSLKSAAIVFLGFVSVAILAQGMKIDIDPLFFIAVMPSIAFVSSLPISIGGWGVREGMMVAGLSLFKLPADAALALSISYGLAGILVTGCIGAVAALVYVLDSNGRKSMDSPPRSSKSDR